MHIPIIKLGAQVAGGCGKRVGNGKVCDTASSQGSLLANPVDQAQSGCRLSMSEAKPVKVGLQKNTSAILQPPTSLASVSGPSRQTHPQQYSSPSLSNRPTLTTHDMIPLQT